MDFRYLSQALAITSCTQDRIQAVLDKFHNHKQVILDAGLYWGKWIIDHFHILKLEFMQAVVPSIPQVGCLLQWSMDTTEYVHTEVVKDPASMTNHHNYDTQICHALDCDEKCYLFASAICLKILQNPGLDDFNNAPLDGTDNNDGKNFNDVLADLWSTKHQSTNFFKASMKVVSNFAVRNNFPPQTIIAEMMAIHLNIEPMHCHQCIDGITKEYGLLDLHGALADYVSHEGQRKFHTFSGPRQLGHHTKLSFFELQVWHKVCL